MILDTLSSDDTVPGSVDFTADSTVLEVALNQAPAGGSVFADAAGNSWIAAGDNLLLMGGWCNIPFGFGQGTQQAYIQLAWKDSLNVKHLIPELAVVGMFTFPNICGEVIIPDGLFLSVPKNLGKVQLVIAPIAFGFGLNVNVSMVGVPAVLDGQTFWAQFHLQVKHTKALAAVP